MDAWARPLAPGSVATKSNCVRAASSAPAPSGKEHGVQSAAGDQLRLVQPSHQAAVPLRWVAERRPADGGESIDTRYRMLSAKPTVKRFGHTVRSHCAIENSLHLCQVPDRRTRNRIVG